MGRARRKTPGFACSQVMVSEQATRKYNLGREEPGAHKLMIGDLDQGLCVWSVDGTSALPLYDG